MKNYTEIEEKLFLKRASQISREGFNVKAYIRNSAHPFAIQLNGGDEMAFDKYGEAMGYMNGMAVARVEITKCSKIKYVARHGNNHGRGSYSDLKFDTATQAAAEIEKTKGAGGDNNQYRTYWKTIGENMYIVVQETREWRL